MIFNKKFHFSSIQRICKKLHKNIIWIGSELNGSLCELTPQASIIEVVGLITLSLINMTMLHNFAL
jgi:hypothetical protein